MRADESPTGWWAPTLKECGDAASPRAFEIRLKPAADAMLEAHDLRCRIDKVSDTAIGYRLHMRCFRSDEDLRTGVNAEPRQIVVDAIGPVTMRADGQRVYRCRSRPAAAAETPRSTVAADPPAPLPVMPVAPTVPALPLPAAPIRMAALPPDPLPVPPPPGLTPPLIPVPVPVPAAPVPAALPTVKRGKVVGYPGSQAPGTIVVDTAQRHLYLVRGDGTAIRYRVAVGRPGASWRGVERVTAKQEWPQWTPTPEMRRSRPGLPRHVAGGPRNPLGARALYLGSSLYRIHGTTDPGSIGRAASSGCFRMLNEDVIELYRFVPVGTRVEVI
jgi:lipoprotein-anchoring transpeptidase ErfK/SrfK